MSCLNDVLNHPAVPKPVTVEGKALIKPLCLFHDGWWELACASYVHHAGVQEKISIFKRDHAALFQAHRGLMLKLARGGVRIEKILDAAMAESESDAKLAAEEVGKNEKALAKKAKLRTFVEALRNFDPDQVDIADLMIKSHETLRRAYIDKLRAKVSNQEQLNILAELRPDTATNALSVSAIAPFKSGS